MPTVADLERLEALVSNLREINGKQRGELIEAEAWNRLVSAVIDIGRATIEDTSDEVAGHTHSDQVSLDWLDPKLRSIVLEGGFGDPGSAAQLGKLERQLVKFGRTLDALSDRLDRMQANLSGLETRDVERETSVGTAIRRLDGVFDARDDVASLRGSLRQIEGQVRTAAELSERLRGDDGEDIDFNDLSGRIQELERQSDRLELPDGNRFDGEAYARDLAQLRAELVTEDELRESLDNLENSFSGDLRAELTEDARAAALEANEGALEGLANDLRAEQTDRIRTLEAALDDRIAASTGDLQEQILTVARQEQTAAMNARLTEFEAARNAELDRRLAALSEDISAQLAGFTETIREDVSAEVARDLDNRLAEFNSRFVAADAARADLSDTLDEVQSSLTTTTRRLDSMQRDLQLADSRLNAQLSERINALEASIDDRIKVATDANRSAMRAERNDELAVLRDQMTVDLNRSLREVAKTEASIATSQLRGEMTEIARAEVSAGLEETRAEMREAGAVSDAQLSGLVAAEVRRATADLDDRIRVTVESMEPANDRVERRRDGGTVIR